MVHHGHRIAGGEVGEFVVIECDELALLGRVLEVRLPERERLSVEPDLGKEAEVHPVGVIQLLATINLADHAVFPGISRYPRLGNRIFSAHPDFVRWLVSQGGKFTESDDTVCLLLATLPGISDATIALTPEQVFGRHCAVLGATGGGKSWTVAKLIEECLRFQSKVVLLDATGEFWRFNDSSVMHASVGDGQLRPDTAIRACFPHMHLLEIDLFAIFRPSGQSQGPKLREAIKSLKLVKIEPILDNGSGNLKKAKARRQPVEDAMKTHAAALEGTTADFDVAPLPQQVREECIWPTDKLDSSKFGDYSNEEQYCLSLQMRIENILQSPDYACIFKPAGCEPLSNILTSFLGNESQRLLRVSLQHVPFGNHAREIVANAIGRQLLKMARDGHFKEQPLIVVVDEAHQFMNRSVGEEQIKWELDSFGLLAKEGRKYGLAVCIATQRPRDIPQDVLSQMGTLIVHRLINDRDREVVERAAGEIDRSAAAFLPTLGPGEAVVIGVDIPIPLSIQIQQPIHKPDSQGPNYQAYWSLPKTLGKDQSCSLAGMEVSLMELGNEKYKLPNGEEKTGPSASIKAGGESMIVGQGSVLMVGEAAWEVQELDAKQGILTWKRVS